MNGYCLISDIPENILIVDKISKQTSIAEKVLNLKSKDLDLSASVILGKAI